MQRITDPTAVATLPSPPALTGTTGYFGPAVPGISPATRVRYWFVTMLQEELMSILAAASITADTTGTVFNQVLLAIKALIGAVPHGVQNITSSGTWTVPAGVTTIELRGSCHRLTQTGEVCAGRRNHGTKALVVCW